MQNMAAAMEMNLFETGLIQRSPWNEKKRWRIAPFFTKPESTSGSAQIDESGSLE
jgi:hypothetical protein